LGLLVLVIQSRAWRRGRRQIRNEENRVAAWREEERRIRLSAERGAMTPLNRRD
jgi:hypothetical protein